MIALDLLYRAKEMKRILYYSDICNLPDLQRSLKRALKNLKRASTYKYRHVNM